MIRTVFPVPSTNKPHPPGVCSAPLAEPLLSDRSFEDGVLEVTIEGAAAVREPKRIQIEGSSNEKESTEGEASGR